MSDDTKPNEVPAAQKMFGLIWPGALAAQAIYCAAKLGIADELHGASRSPRELASSLGAHGGALLRLLRVLSSLGVVVENDVGTFSNTALGSTLRAAEPGSVRPWAIMLGSPFIWRPWGDLLETVKTGEPAFGRVFGCDFYEYGADHPDHMEEYNAAMNAGATVMVDEAVAAVDFSSFGTIVDVGGGRGALLKGVLEAYPQPRGVLLDRPSVVDTAAELRASDVADRCEIVGGDFFEAVPEGDAHLLKAILHGFKDEDAIRILRRVREAVRPGGRLFVLDVVLSETNEPSPQKAMMDLMMLSLAEGHERTEADFRSILEAAGYRLVRVIRTGRGNSVVEGEPA